MPVSAFLAVTAASARDVERHRAEVALLDVLHARPDLDHLTGDLVAQDQTFGGGGPPADHVLVAAADVGRHGLDDRRVGELASDVVGVDARAVLELESRVVDLLHLDLARALVGHSFVLVSHLTVLSSSGVRRAESACAAVSPGAAGPVRPAGLLVLSRARSEPG